MPASAVQFNSAFAKASAQRGARPSITIGIATCNRAKLWRDGKLLRSLAQQTSTDCELVIVDDGSTDGSLTAIAKALKTAPLPFPVRIYRHNQPRRLETHGVARVANVIFAVALAPVFVQLDDDCWADRRLVEFLAEQNLAEPARVLYGSLIFVDEMTGTVLYRDRRIQYVKDHGANRHVRLRGAWRGERGAIWAAPVNVLRDLGGHNVAHSDYRGSDNRIGFRIRQVAPTFFTDHPAMRCWHRGWDWHSKAEMAGDIEKIRRFTRSPERFGFTEPLIVNGGRKFFDTGRALRGAELIQGVQP